MTLSRAFLLTAVLGLSSCGLNSNVSFKDGFNGNQITSATPAPGLGTTNGGFLRKPTSQGNTASLSMGAPISAVQGTTSQGNTFQLNVTGQLKP